MTAVCVLAHGGNFVLLPLLKGRAWSLAELLAPVFGYGHMRAQCCAERVR